MENISKVVLTSDGKKMGYVLDVALDFERMCKIGYYVVDEESENEFLLRNEFILSSSNQYVLIEDTSALEFVAKRDCLFGKEILDENCKSYGRLEKIVFNGKKCEKFVTNKCEIVSKYIKAIGDDVIFAEFKRKKCKKDKQTPFARVDLTEKVQVQTMQIVSKPERVVLSSNFYVGRISSEDIFGYNNEKIVKKGEIVTKSIVDKAKKHNRLNQLFFAVKR